LHILICAHDFQPNGSPQSLRITALAAALVRRGHIVVVLTRTVAPGCADVRDIEGITVYRASPGTLEAMIDAIGSRRRESGSGSGLAPAPTAQPIGLNWKGRVIRRLRQLLDFCWFPDARTAWVSDATKLGRRIIEEFSPEIVIGSHEPGASLMVAQALARRARTVWIAELGDPVLAPYTPRHWRGRAFKWEGDICREAAAVIVTSAATRMLLIERHGQNIAPVTVIPQGFALEENEIPYRTARGEGLRLVYTGRFYRFRDPGPLLDAVLATLGCQLLVAAPELPDTLARRFAAHPDALVFLGSLAHREAVALQREADVLINIGNAGMSQIPGKLLEYLGAGRPILHVEAPGGDVAADIVKEERCGFVVPPDSMAIAQLLKQLAANKRQGRLEEGLRLGQQHFEHYSWDALAGRLESVCQGALGHAVQPNNAPEL
jgi:glycosyltransferase involved in cell wall biosynthesis